MDLSFLRVAGWRGGDLLSLGVLYLGVAVSVVVNPMPEQDLVHTQLWVPARVILWAAPGVIALLCGWHHSRALQNLAFGLLCFAPAERMLSFLWGATFYGNPARWPGAVIYAIVMVMVLRMAARPEPVEPPLPPPLNSLGGDTSHPEEPPT